MKIEKTKIIPEQIIPSKEIKVKEIICDICKQDIANHKCDVCNRDICKKHLIEDYDRFSDYPNYYCIICFNLLKDKYNKLFQDLENKYDVERDTIERQLKQESLEYEI